MSAFKDWYTANKDEFNARRALKRKTDPEYRRKQKAYKKPVEGTPDPHNALNLKEMCDTLGTTIWVVNGWRKRGVLPTLHYAKGKRWVHRDNVSLLSSFLYWFNQHRRISESQFEDMANWVRANWTELEK